ncbi:hypothetical protein H4Q26_004471 [Puccinia striiformis f. sp. tritici PST-130]|nr:hypothetical protein H4Q26_004471 [Puccinia striiformis f. sp. tritici PST-130]
MYFILKQAHASEGHGGRDKTAKAVKKTHSFIRKGLICLFLEVCPTCRARNDAVKKDKLANAQNANEAASPLSHLEVVASSHISTLPPRGRPAADHPGPEHRLEKSALTCYHLPQDQFGQSPVGYASPSPLLSAVGSQVGSQVGSHAGSQVGSVYESYNTDHLNELTTALQQQSFCAPIFSVQVDAPAHESGLPGHEFFLDDQAYYNLQQPQHQHQTSSDAQNSPGSSSNLYDPINVPYLLTSQPDNLYQSSSAPTQFASFSHLASGSQHDRSASNSSVQAHGDNYNKNQMSTVGSTASLEFHSYDPMSSYNPADAGLPDSFAPIPPQDTQRRSFQDKNHKHLSLQTIDTSQDIQGNFRNNNHDSGSYSGPSTAGSMWTTAEDMSTPLLTGDFHDLMSSLSAPAENLRRDDSQVLNF